MFSFWNYIDLDLQVTWTQSQTAVFRRQSSYKAEISLNFIILPRLTRLHWRAVGTVHVVELETGLSGLALRLGQRDLLQVRVVDGELGIVARQQRRRRALHA